MPSPNYLNNYLSVAVSDMERALAFYRLLGLPPFLLT